MGHDSLQTAANIATIVGAFSIVVAVLGLFLDSRRRRNEQRELRKTLLLALGNEVVEVQLVAKKDNNQFEKSSVDDQRGFIWRPLPFAMIEQAMREPLLLTLNPSQITDLLTLRAGVYEMNAFVNAKIALLGAPSYAAYKRAADINSTARDVLGGIIIIAERVRKWSREKLKLDGWVALPTPEESGSEPADSNAQ